MNTTSFGYDPTDYFLGTKSIVEAIVQVARQDQALRLLIQNDLLKAAQDRVMAIIKEEEPIAGFPVEFYMAVQAKIMRIAMKEVQEDRKLWSKKKQDILVKMADWQEAIREGNQCNIDDVCEDLQYILGD